MGDILKPNPNLAQLVRKEFDKMYAEKQRQAANPSNIPDPNRRKIEQGVVLAALGDDERATQLGLARDQRLRIKRKKKDEAEQAGKDEGEI